MPITNVDIFYFCRLECMRVKRDISFHVIQHLLIHTRRLLLHHTHICYSDARLDAASKSWIYCEHWNGRWHLMTVTSREKKNLMQYHVIDSDECAAKERFAHALVCQIWTGDDDDG